MIQHTLIIAEAGVNHNGSIEIAKKLIDAAAEAGVDYIKFQTFQVDKLVTPKAKMATYQKKNIGTNSDSQYNMLKKLELSIDQHMELVEYCKLKHINFFSTAFDLNSIEFLDSLDLGLWKIPSGEITNYPYIKSIAQKKGKVILSTGMCEMSDIENAINVLLRWGKTKGDITILHCNTEYPTPFEDVNLLAMNHIKQHFGVNIGYSDHTKGIEVPIAAVALGANVIEKHFTLDRTMEGPDHKASLEPNELKEMVQSIRNIERAISGNGIKHISDSERKNIAITRKSIVAACDIKKGDTFSENNITVKRPGLGISPMKWEEVIGQVAKQNFEEDSLIEL